MRHFELCGIIWRYENSIDLETILLADIKCIIKAFQVIIVNDLAGSKPWYDGKLWSCFISTHGRSGEKTDRTKADGNSISVQESSSRRTFETSIWRYGDTNAKGTWHLWRHISYKNAVISIYKAIYLLHKYLLIVISGARENKRRGGA